MPHRPPLDLDKARKSGIKFKKNIQNYRAGTSYGQRSSGKLLIDHFRSAKLIYEKQIEPHELTRETANSTRHDTTAADFDGGQNNTAESIVSISMLD